MITILSTIVSILAFRLRRRASLELELIALRHQVSVLRRQHPGRLRLFSTDRLLWVWLYRVWPQVLNAMVLVKPATVVQWHRQGFRCEYAPNDDPTDTHIQTIDAAGKSGAGRGFGSAPTMTPIDQIKSKPHQPLRAPRRGVTIRR